MIFVTKIILLKMLMEVLGIVRGASAIHVLDE